MPLFPQIVYISQLGYMTKGGYLTKSLNTPKKHQQMKQSLVALNDDALQLVNETFIEYTRDILHNMIKEDLVKYKRFLKDHLYEMDENTILQNQDLIEAMNEYNESVLKVTDNKENDEIVEKIPTVINTEEAYMLNKEYNLAKYSLKNYSQDRYAIIGNVLNKEQIQKYDLFKATKLPRSLVKKMVLNHRPENVGLANNNQTTLSILAGMMKLELLKVVENAKLERDRDVKFRYIEINKQRFDKMKEALDTVKNVMRLNETIKEMDDNDVNKKAVKKELNENMIKYNKLVEVIKKNTDMDKKPEQLEPLNVNHFRRVINNRKNNKKNRLKYLK